MPTRSPVDVANELGLKFTFEQTQDGKWTRFKFAMPDVEHADFAAVVTQVSAWRKRIQAWLFVGTVDTVASELTVGNRLRVAWYNRKNRKAIAAFWTEEAVARRHALSQPSPAQGVSVLKATPQKEKATKQLREQLERAETVLGRPEPVVPNLGDQMHGQTLQ